MANNLQYALYMPNRYDPDSRLKEGGKKIFFVHDRTNQGKSGGRGTMGERQNVVSTTVECIIRY